MKAGLVAAIGALVLTGCGGGGDSGTSSTPTPPPTATPEVTPISVKPTSYESSHIGTFAVTIPSNYATKTYALADYKRDGNLNMLVAYATYDVSKPLAQATPGHFEFWSGDAKTKISGLLDTEIGCMSPSGMAVADFNKDGRPDVFVACTGYDASPFPGEKNFIVMSKNDGTYMSRPISNDIGFFHSASAADINGDGNVDVVVADGNGLRAFINDGVGNFTMKSNAFPQLANKSYYTVEVVDVDGDGKLDILAGGHEYDAYLADGDNTAQTVFLKNDGTNTFASVTPTVLPAVANEGVVLGFTVVQKNSQRYVFVVRTAGAAAAGSKFYGTNTVQQVDLANLSSRVAYHAVTDLPLYTLLQNNTTVFSDLKINPVSIAY